jgi:hypothetical protein
MDGPNDSSISTELLPPRLPALGNVKLGGKKEGQKYSVKFDSFVITTRDRGPDGMFKRDDEIHRRLGTDKPMGLDVRLPFETPEQNFYAQMVHYSGKTRAYQCDGHVGQDLSTGVAGPCRKRRGEACQCKPYGRLSLILEAAPTFGGVHVFRTTSWESVAGLQSTLKLFFLQFGSLRGLPLRLVAYPAEVRFKGSDGKDAVGTALKVGLVLRASYDQAAQVALEFHRTNHLARKEILQLVAGTTVELDAIDAEEAGIGQEFFPSRAALPARAESLTDLGRLNAALRADRGEEAEPDPVDEVLEKLRPLLERAVAAKAITEGQEARVRAAMERRDADLGTAVEWLEDQLRPEGGDLSSLLDEAG